MSTTTPAPAYPSVTTHKIDVVAVRERLKGKLTIEAMEVREGRRKPRAARRALNSRTSPAQLLEKEANEHHAPAHLIARVEALMEKGATMSDALAAAKKELAAEQEHKKTG